MQDSNKAIVFHIERLEQARLNGNLFVVRQALVSIGRIKKLDDQNTPTEVFIEYLGPSTNSIYAGIHWTKRKREKAKALAAVKASQLPHKAFNSLVDLRFTPQLGKGARQRDTSNGSYSAKMIEDALVECGVLHDDTGEFVRNVTNTPAIVNRKQPSGTWVTISPVQD